MNVIALSQRQFGANLGCLAAMFRLRRRVFKERLDWSVSVSGDLELDVYDALNPTYRAALRPKRGHWLCQTIADHRADNARRYLSSVIERASPGPKQPDPGEFEVLR
jgi:Autoinducer synthase